jgi:hypothetical protein
LHLGIFEQPAENDFFSNLLIRDRAGDISHKLADKIAEERVGRSDPRELEKEIKESLLRGFLRTEKPELDAERKKETEEREQAMKEYRKFQSKFLLSIADSKLTHSEKIGDGKYSGKGDDLVDGVFKVGDQRVGVCTFSVSPALAHSLQGSFFDLLTKIANEIRNGTFNKVILAFNDSLTENNTYTASFNKFRDIIQKDISDSIIMVDDCDGSGALKVEDIFKKISGNA